MSARILEAIFCMSSGAVCEECTTCEDAVQAAVRIANGVDVGTLSFRPKGKEALEKAQERWADFVARRVANRISWRKEGYQPGDIIIDANYSENLIRWTVHPLPLGHAALPASELPSLRSASPNPSLIELQSWRTSWGNLSTFRVFQPEQLSFCFSEDSREPLLEMGARVQERPCLEYKMGTSSHIFKPKSLRDYRTSQQLSVLCTPGRKEYLFGVHDKSETVIGMQLDEFLMVDPEFEPFFQQTFPSLTFSVAVDRTTLPTRTFEGEDLWQIGPVGEKCIACILVHFSGQAVVIPSEADTLWLVVVANLTEQQVTSLRNSYTQVRNVKVERHVRSDDYSPGHRSLISIQWNDPEPNVYVSADWQATVYGLVSPLSLWLRWHSQEFLSEEIKDRLQSHARRRVLLSIDGVTSDMIRHSLSRLRILDIEECTLDSDLSEFHDPFDGSANLLLLPLSAPDKFFPIGRNSSWAVVVLVHRRDLDDSKSMKKLMRIARENPISEVIVILPDPSASAPFPGAASAQYGPFCPIDHSVKLLPEQQRQEYCNWMITRTSPTWEVAGILFKTHLIRTVVDFVLGRIEHSNVHIPFLKSMPACGATATVMAVAHLLHDKNRNFRTYKFDTVLSNSKSPDPLVADEVAVIVLDDCNWETVETVQAVAHTTWTRSVILSVHEYEDRAKKPPNYPWRSVSPYLAPSDKLPFGDHLKGYFPDHTDAIDIVVNRACAEQHYLDSHLYLFCMAATRGERKPPREWLQHLQEKMLPVRGISDAAWLFSFTTVFVPSFRYSCLVRSRLTEWGFQTRTDQERRDSATEAFHQLFYPRQHPVIHPIFAMSILDPDMFRQPCSFDTVQALATSALKLFEDFELNSQLSTLLLNREENTELFSPFVKFLLFGDETTHTARGQFIKKVLVSENAVVENVSQVYRHVLLSRCYRCLARNETGEKKQSKLMDEALSSAKEALKANPKSRLARHNAACIMAVVAEHYKKQQLVWSYHGGISLWWDDIVSSS